LEVKQSEFPKALTKDCFLDLSSFLYAPPQDLSSKKDFGPLPDALRSRILEALSQPIKLLHNTNRELALRNLSR
jgi:hypothetical protein